ncbi:hypothetical protein TWF694_009872 [Orbilia ellipsospora]|uniref:Uncharacterized protein n=1 Tax=Orbilia ellipsospora TaxID=2528407 RepID=A0AAV9XDH8_9PEZI
MGGSAFAKHGLTMLRLSPRAYTRLKAHHRNLLSTLYAHVTTPPEAPGKTSHGDIDFLVADPLPSLFNPDAKQSVRSNVNGAGHTGKLMDRRTVEIIKSTFGADFTTVPETTTSYAVPLTDEDVGDTETNTTQHTNGKKEKPYVQIDVHVCPSAENMHWMAFKHSYGDMWSLLGMMARAKGLVADEERLSVRVEEIEGRNRELAKVELTRDVGETLRFFGLDEEVYHRGFKDLNEVYKYVEGCRFYSRVYFRKKAYRNCRDNKKLGKRDMMKGFFGYLGLPVEAEDVGEENEELEDEGESEDEDEEEEVVETEEETGLMVKRMRPKLRREMVLEEALEKFGKRKEYEEKVRLWRRDVKIEAVGKIFTDALFEGEHCSLNSARNRGGKLRKEIRKGEHEEVFEMDERELKAFVERQIERYLKDIQVQPTKIPKNVVAEDAGQATLL